MDLVRDAPPLVPVSHRALDWASAPSVMHICPTRRFSGVASMIERMAARKLSSNTYDAIVVGSRCAGSPTAMLLARKGYRVLLVDRATFPSDTISTHVVHPLATAALARWGLLDPLTGTA